MRHAKWFTAAVAAGWMGVAAAQSANTAETKNTNPRDSDRTSTSSDESKSGLGAHTTRDSAATTGTGSASAAPDSGSASTGSTDPRQSERTTPATDQQHSGIGAAQGSGTGATTSGTATGESAATSGQEHAAGMRSERSDMKRTLADMHAGNEAEIQAGQWMQQHATSSKVKDFAKKMVDDHGALDRDGQAFAQKHNLDLTSVPAYQSKTQEHQSMLDQMKSMQGAELDRHYMQMMVEDHQKDTSAVKAALDQAKSSKGNDEYAKLLDKAEKKMSDHLKDAQKIARDLGSRQARNPANQ